MQDYADYEVLISDGGSTDNSRAIIDNYCKKDSRFRLISAKDFGQSDGIVKAFSMATGDIFCFLNADDLFICRDAFSAVVSTMKSYRSSDVVSFRGYYLDASGAYIKPVNLRYHPLDNISLMKYRAAVLQPATFWRRKVYEKIPLDQKSHYVFDTIFFYHAYLQFSWLECMKPVAGHRLHGKNKSLQINSARVKELVDYERMKFGVWAMRASYLRVIQLLVTLLGGIPFIGKTLNRCLYTLVNSLSFLTCYRLPGI
jgi:glycosyltransferase involved in cell wall biosynthesis